MLLDGHLSGDVKVVTLKRCPSAGKPYFSIASLPSRIAVRPMA